MMGLTLRLAMGLHRGDRRSGGWRVLLIGAGAALAALCGFLVLGLALTQVRAAQREAARLPVSGDEVAAAAADLTTQSLTANWNGRPLQIVVIERRAENAPLPPGLPEGAPEGWYVSPALAREARRDAHLHVVLGDAGLIGWDGVRDGEELYAYRLVPPGALEGRGLPVEGWGRPAAWASGGIPVLPLVAAGFVFVAFPSLLLLAVAHAADSRLRTRRLTLLHWLGTPRAVLGRAALVESAAIAAVASFVAAAGWWVWARQRTVVPGLGAVAAPGDLLPAGAWWVLPPLAASTASGVFGWAATRRRILGAQKGPRPGAGVPRRRLAARRVLSLGALALIGAAAVEGPTRRGASLTVLAVAASLAVLLFVMSDLAALMGRLLAMLPPVTGLLAGRRIQNDPDGATRPLVALAAFVVVGMVTTSYLAVVRFDDDPVAKFPLYVARVDAYAGASDAAIADFQERLGDTAAILVPDGVRLKADCEALSRIGVAELAGGQEICRDGVLTPAGIERLQEIGLDTRQAAVFGRVRPLVVVAAPSPDMPAATRAAALASFTLAFGVEDRGAVPPREPAVVAWILAGFWLAAILLVLSLSVVTADRLLRAQYRHRVLAFVGLTARRLAWLEFVQFATVLVVAVGTASALGVAEGSLMTSMQGIPLPWRVCATFTGAALAAGLVPAGLGSFRAARFAGRRELARDPVLVAP